MMFGTTSASFSDGGRGGLLRNSYAGSAPSEDDDALSSVSKSASTREQRPSVTCLRDRLLKEARSERQRCLEVAEAAERRKLEVCGKSHASTQTDPVLISDAGGGAGSAGTSASMPTVSVLPLPLAESLGAIGLSGAAGGGAGAAWTSADDEAQSEALRTIQTLGQRCAASSRQTEAQRLEVEGELRAERTSRQELESQVSHERNRKEAAQQQVMCLEYELDGKEAALQVAERALERRDADLAQAQDRLRAAQGVVSLGSAASQVGGEDIRVLALRSQLQDKERQLELKDQHISRLLNVLRQHRGIFTEDDSTVCGSAVSAA